MRVLFTGACSYTGLWFVRVVARAGHEVVAVFRRQPQDYAEEPRRQRVALALRHCRGVHGASFGDARFLELAAGGDWDLLCHHAADASNYRSPDFDPSAALAANTRGLAAVLDALRAKGRAPAVLVTGSVFENDEGAGSQGLPAFSPYGLSKSFTWQTVRYHAERLRLPLGKFVIPNPFGPYEEPRFTTYLVRTWAAGKAAAVNTPAYVRDNIHVSLLAARYAAFAASLAARGGPAALHPSGYVESQGAFALRFAREMRPRLGLACEVELRAQSDFAEPMMRVNTDAAAQPGWDEAGAWDEAAAYYRGMLGEKR
jgi:nucleoside-diphosphate-sugar epimerase